MNTLMINKSNCATDLWFSQDKMHLLLYDGRELAVPVDWFTALRDATSEQRNNFRFKGAVKAFIGKTWILMCWLSACCDK